MANKIVAAIGHHAFWGYSSSFDVLEALYGSRMMDANNKEPINILLVNPGDIRHILTTIARRRRHVQKGIITHIYY